VWASNYDRSVLSALLNSSLSYEPFFDRFDSEGKGSSMDSVGSGITALSRNGSRSMYSDRVFLSHFTTNPSLGDDKVNIQHLADSKLTHHFCGMGLFLWF